MIPRISAMARWGVARAMAAVHCHRWWMWGALLLVVVAAGAADARVGGGQSFSSGGGGRSRGGGYSGGGGGGDGIGILIWLLLEHPVIGVPTLLIVIGLYLHTQKQKAQQGRTVVDHGFGGPTASARFTSRTPRERLVEVDSGFSEPLLIDFFQQVYTTARQRAPSGETASLAPWFTTGALGHLVSTSPKAVRDVIFGSTRLSDAAIDDTRVRVEVVCEVNLVGTDAGGNEQQWLRQERWTLGRRAGVTSPGPDRMQVLCCASCGDPSEPELDGTCGSCGSVRTGGETQWEVEAVQVMQERPLPGVALHPGGGVEPGTRQATVFDPEIAVAKRRFINRHPQFSWSDFDARVRHVFAKLQESWSARRLEDARAYQTDALFQVHRFWMARYKRDGLYNRMSDLDITWIDVAKVTRDAWFESVTVRVYASMCDWTERESDGVVVGGSRTDPRVFSEYWTFVRTIGSTRGAVEHTLDQCPSCGAPLDQVSAAGVCGYCDSKITGGDFDWVLSRIEQDEVYRG